MSLSIFLLDWPRKGNNWLWLFWRVYFDWIMAVVFNKISERRAQNILFLNRRWVEGDPLHFWVLLDLEFVSIRNPPRRPHRTCHFGISMIVLECALSLCTQTLCMQEWVVFLLQKNVHGRILSSSGLVKPCFKLWASRLYLLIQILGLLGSHFGVMELKDSVNLSHKFSFFMSLGHHHLRSLFLSTHLIVKLFL